MWLVAYYDEYEGFDINNSGEKLFRTKREAKRYARRMNKKWNISETSANGFTYCYIELGKEEKKG